MNQGIRAALTAVAVAAATAGAWALWLGWDQLRDTTPDGGSSGPYEPWQVVGLVLTLTAIVLTGIRRGVPWATVAAFTTALTVSAYVDWSDDETGLFMVGVTMIAAVSLTISSFASLVLAPRPPAPRP
ncbi:hypothetical protein GCM10027589_17910 [Actinocorallia lasiicapitis]